MKLGKQLFLLFTLITAVPLVGAWFWLGSTMYAREVADVRERHLLIAKNLAAALERYHTDIMGTFNIISRYVVEGNNAGQAVNTSHGLQFRHICIARYDTGKVIRQLSPVNALCPQTVPAKRFAYFKKLQRPGKAVMSPVLAGPQNLNLMYVVRRYGDKLAIGAVTTDYFINLGRKVSFGKKGHAAIIDQNGNILAHPLASWAAQRKNISKVSAVARILRGEQGVEVFHSPAFKGRMIAGFASVPRARWGVMIPQPVSELVERANAGRNSLFLVLALCVTGAALLALLVGRMMVGSLAGVLKGAQDMQRGKTSVRIKVDERWHVPQEFKILQRRFNLMASAVAKFSEQERKGRLEAERQSKTKAEYLAGLGHELRTPLNSILGFSGILLKSKTGNLDNSRQGEFLAHIEKSAGHLLSFVNDLIDLNRIDMGAHALNEIEYRACELIRFSTSTLRRKIEDNCVSIDVVLPDGSLKFVCDERSMNQMVINIIDNAINYSPEGAKITIRADILDDGSARLGVSDPGIGIAPDQIRSITRPFKRGNDPDVTSVPGTGLGLSIVSKLAQLHNITLDIQSEKGKGSTISLIIPRARAITREQHPGAGSKDAVA